MAKILEVVLLLGFLAWAEGLAGSRPSDGEPPPDDGLYDGAGEDLGLILYITGVNRSDIPQPIMKDLCVAATRAVSTMRCNSIWSDGALVKSTAGEFSELEKEKALEHMAKMPGLPPGAMVHFEPNLPVVEGGMFVQRSAPINLGRLDQAANRQDYEYRYMTTGKGVTVYVLDKGINAKHVDFKYRDGRRGSRVKYGTRTFSSDPSCAGHGTHVAGIVGGLKFGVAKDVELVMVQVQPCSESGTVEFLLKGMDWLLSNIKYPAVAQMSLLALGTSYSLNRKVQQIIDARVPFVLSAGNYAKDACYYSPAMVAGAIVVGNVEYDDRINGYSNYGSCVDLFAPGTSIASASSVSNTQSAVMTGTSQAAPHVSGIVAQIFEREPWASVDDVMTRLLDTAAVGVVKNPKGSPNFLVQTDLSPLVQTVVASINIPGMAISPPSVQAINLFEATPQATGTRNVTITNFQGGKLQYNITLDAADGSDVHSWLSVSKQAGLLEVGQQDVITIHFDSSSVGQGIFQADVVIEGNDPDRPKHTMRALMRVFCPRLTNSADEEAGLVEMRTARVTEMRPSSWGPEIPGGEPPSIYLEATLVFMKPVVNIDPAFPLAQIPEALTVKGGGFIDLVEESKSGDALCSKYHVRARAPVQDVWEGTNQVCLQIPANTIFDVNQSPIPEAELCAVYNDGPEAKLFGAYMTYTSDQKLVTDESEILIVSAFSEEVEGVDKSKFYVEAASSSGGKVVSVSPVEGTKTFYHVTVSLQEDFYGSVEVGVRTGIRDKSGKKLGAVRPLEFTRVKKCVVKHMSYDIKEEL